MTDGDADDGADGSETTAGADDTPADESPLETESTADARVIAIASGKGGVGKTTTAVNLAAWMADADRDVVVVDFDLGMANLADVLAFEQATDTLHDVLAGDAATDDALVETTAGFSVLPGGTSLADFGRADPANLRDVVDDLRERFDVVLLDSGAGLSHDTSLPLGLADEVVLVTTAEVASIANTRKTRDLAERLEGTISGLVLTRVGEHPTDRTDAVSEDLDLPLLGRIPEDAEVAAAAAAGSPLSAHAPDSPATRAYRALAYDLLGEALPDDARVDAEAEAVSEADESDAESEGVDDAESEDAIEEVDGDAESEDAADAEATDDGSDEADQEDAEEADDGATSLVEEAEPEKPEPKRGLLSRLTGGLIGGKK